MSYYQKQEAENAMAVVASWISENDKVKVRYHKGTAVSADIYKGQINIPRMACASGVTQEALMLLRGQVYHEAGHIAETKMDKKDQPSGALFNILNALEDRREERKQAGKHAGCGPVFKWNNEYYNKKIAEQVSSGKANAPLWEALCAMSFMAESIRPAWTLTPKAQKYFDVAYDEFIKVAVAESVYDCLEIAKRIYELVKDVNEQEKKEQKKKEQKKQKSKDKPQQKEQDPEKGESDNCGSGEDEQDEDAESKDGDKSEEDSDEEDSESEDKSGSDDSGEEGSEGEESKGLDTDEDAESKNGSDGKGDKELEKKLEEESTGAEKSEVVNERLGELFKEMDPVDSQYLSLRDNDKHLTIETTDDSRTTYESNRSAISAAVTSLTGAFEQALRALARCRKKPYLRHGKIDKKRLVQIVKGTSKEVFFRNRTGETLDTAVSILIDESGSMGRSYVAVRLLTIAVAEALNRTGIPFEVIGTTTLYAGDDSQMPPLDGLTRTNPMIYKHYKNFNEAWNTVAPRITGSGFSKHNVDGEAVEYAANVLAQRDETRKVIFSLSDGRPDSGHGNDSVFGENLKRVCERCRKNGIEVYGFGIKTELPRDYYGEKYFLYLDDVLSMGTDFVRKMVEILTKGKVRV